jgi:hypothetical protein
MPTFTDIKSFRPARPAVAADLVVGARESRTTGRSQGWEGERMKLYADRPARVVRQLMGDVLVVLLVYASVRLGMAANDRVAALAGPGREAEATARDVDGRMRDAAGQVGDAPLVGGTLAKPFESLADASAALASSARSYQDTVADVARLTGVVLAGAPILLLLAVWLTLRLGWVVEASAATRLRRTGRAGAELLAVRAMVSQPLRRLARVEPAVITGWRAGDPAAVEALAALELRSLGLLSPPTGDFPGRNVHRDPGNSPVEEGAQRPGTS